ncbi:MAG: CDP-6-deoxy-delta-3,4-glucoseen reductase [Sterolibacterium sp.]|jgi:CDP-4-dehydro-6-deoxyglucose reductase|nr:CDP-6-deoxy-delta-3,4-glucoseen reductase [Sterolibacterium sp.]
MSHHITVQPSGHTYDTEEGATLLQAAIDAGIKLPYGCQNGACGACKGKVVSGEFDHGAAPEGTLPQDQRDAGMALFCCAKPLSDLVIEAKEVTATQDIPVKTLPCRVQKLERLAADVIALHLKLPTNERLQFLAGQYIEILLKNGERRAFSLANAPHDDELLQLHIRLVPDGTYTGHVFHAMKERDMLRFEGPHGSFFLREDAKKPMILLAGGTGFAPIKSLIEHALHNKTERPMTLYWGSKDHAGLYLPDLPRQWAAEHAHFSYVPVLSEPPATDAWTGRTGFVHRAVLEDHADLSGFQVYACGAPAMIDAARRDFIAQGLPEEEFFADSFTFAHPA